MANQEPVYTAHIASGLATGTGFIVLQQPITDILLEIGWSDRLSKAVVSLLMFCLPVGVSLISAWWTRKRTVPLAVANSRIEEAFNLPANSPQSQLEVLKVTKED